MASKPKPLIGVTGPDCGGWPAWFCTKLAIMRAGGRALRITPTRLCGADRLDGLVIGGGADVDPKLYSEEPVMPQIRKQMRREMHRRFRNKRKFGVRKVVVSVVDLSLYLGLWLLRRLMSAPWHQAGDRARDKVELELINQGLMRGIPILGICRGMQLLNVSFGGSLIQEISTFYEESPQLKTVLPRKKITLNVQSKFYKLMHTPSLRVNSLHFQSVNKIGRGLRIVAQEQNGIVQAIEHDAYDCVLGVQWHPEFLPQDRTQQNIFRYLVYCAGLPHVAAVRQTVLRPEAALGYKENRQTTPNSQPAL